MRLTTRQFALDGPEWATTAVAVVVSSAAYVTGGLPYLSRGVLGDLAGLGLLAGVVLVRGERLRHEALLCLGAIGLVLLVDPRWPVRVTEPVWWSAFALGLLGYVVLRRRVLQPARGPGIPRPS